MAMEFGVSRITLREAMKILSGRGLVSTARGRRAVVRQTDGAMFGAFLTSLIKSDPKNLFDLLQVRRALEIQSLTLAARHASRSGMAAVEAALNAMGGAAEHRDPGDTGPETELAFQLADVRFHEAMALCGGNRVLIYLFEAMESSLLEAFATSHRGLLLVGQTLEDLCAKHVQVFHHIAARDEKASVDSMSAILDHAEDNLRAAISSV